MWTLYEIDKTPEGEKHRFLKPLVFSNGKSQEDVVGEVLDSLKEGHKIIFIKGVCGTGKSAIALHLAKELGKTSIVVPGKNLQAQYKKDYEGNKYLLGKDGRKMKISVITGRNNHPCCFIQNNGIIPKFKKEINSLLSDIFEFNKEEEEKRKRKDNSADVYDLPCKIELKEKNWRKIKEYIRQNDKTDPSRFLEIKDVTRAAVAGACPYWSPVLPEKFEIKSFPDSKKRRYEGLNNTKFIIHPGRPGCKFYEQFNSYIDSDVMVFNSLKYILETALNRKPLTEVEIIDECDEFLDSFSNHRTINIDKLQTSLIYAVGSGEHFDKSIKEIAEITKEIKRSERIQAAVSSGDIIPLKETGIYDLIKVFINSPEFLSEIDDENYLVELEETSRMFEGFLDESYVTFNKKDNSLIASVVTINLAKKFRELIDKNKKFVLMSGTLHSEEVLKGIFGLDDFKTIDAETMQQGQIEIQRTGLEKDCKYSNFSIGKISREQYLKSLDKCVEIAKKPALVHINAFSDLPIDKEIEAFNLKNIVSREKLKEIQGEDKEGKLIEEFKKGKTKVLFSTRAARGIDFPGEQCNSIIFTKYPNPNTQDAFWKILNQTNPRHYWSFYKDKARRELLQKIYRGLRFKEDHIYLLSPDSRVLEAFEKKVN